MVNGYIFRRVKKMEELDSIDDLMGGISEEFKKRGVYGDNETGDNFKVNINDLTSVERYEIISNIYNTNIKYDEGDHKKAYDLITSYIFKIPDGDNIDKTTDSFKGRVDEFDSLPDSERNRDYLARQLLNTQESLGNFINQEIKRDIIDMDRKDYSIEDIAIRWDMNVEQVVAIKDIIID